MDPLVLVGVAVVSVTVTAVGVLRWRRTSHLRARYPADASSERLRPAWNRSEKLSAIGIAVGAAVGLAGFILPGDGQSTSESSKSSTQVNARAVAALIRAGPFTEDLPGPLEPGGISDVNLGDPSSARRVDAVQLKVRDDGSTPFDIQMFAHLEVYSSPQEATERGEAAIETIKQVWGRERLGVEFSAKSYCAYLDPDAWQCGGVRGIVYVEVTLSPSPNATRPFAQGTVSAVLNYADEKTALAD